MTSPRVVLCGPMGSGKSAAGRRIAAALDLPLRDTDLEIERVAGATIPEIFESQTEAGFRALERDVVVDSLAGFDGVLALGGGAVTHPDARAALSDYRTRGGVVIFLDVSAHVAAQRIGSDQNRPLLHGPGETPRQRWARIMGERRGWYLEVSSHTVVTDRRTPAAVAREILGFLPSTG